MWFEGSITVAVSVNPNQYAKITVGAERLSTDDSPAALRKIHQDLHDECTEFINEKIEELKQLADELDDE